MTYIIIVVNGIDERKNDVEFDNLKIEYVAIGQQFHGRHFKGRRPTHVIDQTGTEKWYDYFNEITKHAKRMAIK